MTQYLNKFGISFRIIGVVSTLAIAMFVYASLSLVALWSEKTDIEHLDEVIAFAPYVSKVVHELQNERGASAGYINSNGATQYKSILDMQKRTSNNAIVDFKAHVSDIHLDEFDEEFVSLLNRSISEADGITSARRNVEGLSSTTGQMTKEYTSVIHDLMLVIEEVATLTHNAELLSEVTAYIAVLEQKEAAGLERATGAAAFVKGSVTGAELNNFISLISKQETFSLVFHTYATPNFIAEYDRLMSGSNVQTLEQLRDVVISSSGDFTGHSAVGTTE